MQKTVYQVPELRDANDNIIQEGAFGKNTALSNSTNDGWIDYVMNNLEALHDVVGETSPTLDGNGHVVEPANLAIGDEDGNRIKNSYLKLSGGKVTGIASFRTDLRMLDNQDNRWGGLYVPGTTSSVQYLSLYGGTRATGDARLNLYSVGNGKFELTGYSTDGANAYTLTHNNNGALLWRGGELAPKASPAFTGTPTAPTPANNDNSTKLATTAFVNTKAGNYLPLSGGTMTGTLVTNKDPAITRNVDNSFLVLCGGTAYNKGAFIYLAGEGHSDEGGFDIHARKTGTGDYKLSGRTNGALTWGGQNVCTEDNFPRRYSIYTSSTVGGSLTVPYGQWLLIVSTLGNSVPSEAHYVGLLGIGNDVGTVDIKKGSNYSVLGLTLTKSGSSCVISVTSQYTYISAIRVVI